MFNAIAQLAHLQREWWKDCRGVVNSAESLILMTVLAIGMIVGLCAVRWSVVQELGDVSVALERLDQTYSATVGGVVSNFQDQIVLDDTLGNPPGNLCTSVASSEN
jgi:hypothetical protein